MLGPAPIPTLMATTSAVGTVSSGSQSDAKLTQDVESSTNVRSIFPTVTLPQSIVHSSSLIVSSTEQEQSVVESLNVSTMLGPAPIPTLMATTSAVGTVSSGSQSDAKLTQDVESSTNVRSIFPTVTLPRSIVHSSSLIVSSTEQEQSVVESLNVSTMLGPAPIPTLMATTSAVGTVSSGSQSDAKLTQDVESSTNVRSIFPTVTLPQSIVHSSYSIFSSTEQERSVVESSNAPTNQAVPYSALTSRTKSLLSSMSQSVQYSALTSLPESSHEFVFTLTTASGAVHSLVSTKTDIVSRSQVLSFDALTSKLMDSPSIVTLKQSTSSVEESIHQHPVMSTSAEPLKSSQLLSSGTPSPRTISVYSAVASGSVLQTVIHSTEATHLPLVSTIKIASELATSTAAKVELVSVSSSLLSQMTSPLYVASILTATSTVVTPSLTVSSKSPVSRSEFGHSDSSEILDISTSSELLQAFTTMVPKLDQSMDSVLVSSQVESLLVGISPTPVLVPSVPVVKGLSGTVHLYSTPDAAVKSSIQLISGYGSRSMSQMGFGSSVMLPSTEVVIRVSDTPSMTSTRLSYQSSYLSQLASVGTEIQQVISPSDIKPITVTYPTTDTGTIQQGKSAFTSTLMGKFSLSVSPSGFEEVDTSLVPNIVSTLERSRASVFSSLSLSQISREVATTSLITPALSIVKSSLAVGTELSIRPSPVESFVETIPAAVRSMSDYIFRSSDLELVASFSVSSTLLDVGGFSSLQSFAAGTSLSTNIIPSQQASVVSVLLPFLSTAALDLSVGYMTETASLVTVTAASLGSPLGMGAISSVMPSPVVTFTDKLPLESSSMLTSVEVISQLPTVPDQYSTSQHFVVNSTEGFSSVTPTLVSVVQSLSTSQPTPLSVDSVDYISFISVTTIVDSVISISSSQESTSADYTSSLRPLNFSTTTQFATTQTSLPVSIIFSSSQESTPTDYTSLLRPIDFTRHFSTTQTSFSAAISSVHQVPMEVVLPLTTSRLFTTALVVKSPSTMDTTLSVHPSPTRTSIGNIVVESASLLTSKEITSYSSTSLSLLMPSSQFPVVSSIVDSSLSGASSSSTVHVPNPFPSPTPTPTPESIIDFADLYPFGDNQGDKRMLPGDDDVSEPIIAPYGFPFFGKIKEKLHICINGFLSLDSEYCSFQPTLLPFINRHSVIAPFWTDIDTRVSQESNLTNGSAVYYHVYSGSQTDAVSREMLSVITRDVRRYSREILDYDIFSDFNASWATVVTWFQVAPYNGYVYQDTELATFQAVAATNGVFSAVLFVYPYNDIQWPSHAEFPAIMGYSSDDYKNFYNHPNSRTSELFQITEEIGNTHRQGRWFFRVDGNTQQLSPPQECVQWYMHQPDPPADLQPCPCTYEQALIDTRYLITFDSLCADRRFPLSDSSGQLCCYSKPPDGLSVLYNSYVLSGAPKGSRYTRYHISDYDNFAAEDLWPFQKCCIESRLCHLYSERRPPLSCKGYIRPGRGKNGYSSCDSIIVFEKERIGRIL
jgi:hypothetical protein